VDVWAVIVRVANSGIKDNVGSKLNWDKHGILLPNQVVEIGNSRGLHSYD